LLAYVAGYELCDHIYNMQLVYCSMTLVFFLDLYALSLYFSLGYFSFLIVCYFFCFSFRQGRI